jgi:hypothetical protein
MKNLLSFQFASILMLVCFLFACRKEIEPNVSIPESSIVSEALANDIATHFNKRGGSLKSSSDSELVVLRTVKNIYAIKDFNQLPAIYVINYHHKAGFLMLSAEPKHEPILAYSDKGEILEFDTINAGFECWLEKTLSSIMAVRYGSFDNSERAYTGWNNLMEQTGLDPNLFQSLFAKPLRPKPTDQDPISLPCNLTQSFQIGPYLSTEWGQDWVYGSKIGSGPQGCTKNSRISCNSNYGLPWTGCVATAMAQILRYWSFPKSYNYTLIPNRSLDPGWNVNAFNEAGRLFWDIGKSVCMDYGCEGSSAYMQDIDDGLRSQFGYSSATHLGAFSFNHLINDLSLKRPVILSGCARRDQTSYGWWVFSYTVDRYSVCHAWVCDGIYGVKNFKLNYNANNLCSTFYYYHMNWGWDGRFNGWYYWNDWSAGTSVPSPSNTRLATLTNLNFQYAKDQISNIQP